MYTLEGRVRYSEVDFHKRMTIPALINYLQDCCTFQGEDAGIGLDFLQEKKRAWFINSWQIEILDMPLMADAVKVHTWAYEFKGFYGFRNFLVEDAQGHIYAKVNSIWIFMDMDTLRPTRVDKEIGEAYGKDPQLDGEWPARKISLLPNLCVQETIEVQKNLLDTNQHVNNEKYIELAIGCLPEGYEVKHIRVEYRSAAVLRDTIVMKTAQQENDFQVVMCDEEDNVYAIVEFKR